MAKSNWDDSPLSLSPSVLPSVVFLSLLFICFDFLSSLERKILRTQSWVGKGQGGYGRVQEKGRDFIKIF